MWTVPKVVSWLSNNLDLGHQWCKVKLKTLFFSAFTWTQASVASLNYFQLNLNAGTPYDHWLSNHSFIYNAYPLRVVRGTGANSSWVRGGAHPGHPSHHSITGPEYREREREWETPWLILDTPWKPQQQNSVFSVTNLLLLIVIKWSFKSYV